MGSTGADARAPRIPFIPSLDGIRALAVVAVLLYHADLWWIPGGFLGVEVFFVLSGYLITSLLWSEIRRTGGIDLRGFWARRARRLLPAVFALLTAVAAAFVLGWPGEVASVRGDIAAAFGYVSNWYLVGTDQSYFEAFARPSPLRHLWSLAIEEQFYVLWPLALFGLTRLLRSRRRIAGAALLASITSAAAMWLLYSAGDPSRAYYGTDSRASGLLLGAALALVWRPFHRPERAPRIDPNVLDASVVAALVFLTWSFLKFDEFTPSTHRPGIQLVAIATAVLIAAVVHPAARAGAVLGSAPMRWLGRRSYGIYLWHWPVFVLTRPGVDLYLHEGLVLGVRIGITLAIAEASYRFIEQPFRSGVVGEAVRGVLARIVLSPMIRRRAVIGWTSIFTALMLAFASLAAAVVRAPAPAAVGLASAAVWDIEDPPILGPVSAGRDPDQAISKSRLSRPRPRRTPGLPIGTPAVIAIGDSVMLGARGTMRGRIGGIYVDALLNRSFGDGIRLLKRIRAADRLGEAVVIHLGNNGRITDEQFDEMMRVLEDVDVVAFVNVRVLRRWERPVNAVLENGVARYRQAVLVDWHDAWRSCPGRVFASDGIHLSKAGASCYTGLIAAAI